MIEDLAITIVATEIGLSTEQRAMAAALTRNAAKAYAALTGHHEAAELLSNLASRFRSQAAGSDIKRTLRRR